MDNIVPVGDRNVERVLIDTLMDTDSEVPIMNRLERVGINRSTLKDITGGSSFDQELFDHCRGEILLPAMAKVLKAMVGKACGGSIQATRTYLELMKFLNTKQDVNVNILQYQGLSDSELDRRLEAELRRHGLDLGDDGEVIDVKIGELPESGSTTNETELDES